MGVRDEDLAQFVGSHVVTFAELVLAEHLARRELDRYSSAARPQLVEVPVLGVALGGGAVDVGADHVVNELLNLLAVVLTGEDCAALAVDDLALLVHHLVVL